MSLHFQCDTANKNLILQGRFCYNTVPIFSSSDLTSPCSPAKLQEVVCYFKEFRKSLVHSWSVPIPNIVAQCMDEYDCYCQRWAILLLPLPGNQWTTLHASSKRRVFEAQLEGQSADLKWTKWHTLSTSKVQVRELKRSAPMCLTQRAGVQRLSFICVPVLWEEQWARVAQAGKMAVLNQMP